MFKVSWPYALLSGYYVGNCLRLFAVVVAMVMAVMGDVCSKYHGHMHYYQATMLVINEGICCCHFVVAWRW